jgi:predicted phosphate transport protein (TIGR00153 family)
MPLLPRDERFFDLFQQHVRILCEASELFNAGLSSGFSGVARTFPQMEALERNADEVIHEIFRRLQSTFITPFDPEDIQALATGLDNVLDAIEDVTFRISCYRIDPVPAPALQLGQMIDNCCRAIQRAMTALRDRKPVWDDCIEVNRLENQADAIERTAMGDLFGFEIDPVTLIKHKDLYELLERTTDLCEDVADIIQNVAVKNS